MDLLDLLTDTTVDLIDFERQKWNLEEKFELTSKILLLKTKLSPFLLDFLLEHDLKKVQLPLNFIDSVHFWLKEPFTNQPLSM